MHRVLPSTGVCLLALPFLLGQACQAGPTGTDPTQVSPPARESPDDRPAATAPTAEQAVAEQPAPTQQLDGAGTFDWEMRAEPTRLTMAERSSFYLLVRATNRGTERAAPSIHSCQLTVNGERSMSFDLGFGNGVMEPGRSGLEPNGHVETKRKLGEGLFPAPGDYVLVFTGGKSRSTVTIRVTP